MSLQEGALLARHDKAGAATFGSPRCLTIRLCIVRRLVLNISAAMLRLQRMWSRMSFM
jgi:hypothetical protein